MNDTRLTEQAATWYLDLREGDDPSMQARFMAWLRQSPRHVAEYMAIAQLHGDMRAAVAAERATQAELTASAASEASVVPLFVSRAPVVAPTKARARRIVPRAAAAAVAAMLVGVIAVAWPIPETAGITYTATASQVREVRLEDGTLVQIAPGSRMVVRYDDRARRIELLHGNASFDVGKDPLRRLTVTVGDQRIEDVGTVFDVHRTASVTDVTVLSGEVDVLQARAPWVDRLSRRLTGAAATPTHVVALHGGETASVDDEGTLLSHVDADVSAATAWLPPDIAFRDETVAEVARRFHAYGTTTLDVADPELARKRISGVFHARDPEAFIAYLASLPHVRVQRDTSRVRFTTAPRL